MKGQQAMISISSLKKSILVFLMALTACSQLSPNAETAIPIPEDNLSGQEIFSKTFNRHGGLFLSMLEDINLAIDGKWYFLITKIQPDLTDDKYRQKSQERLLLNPPVYASHYTGNSGTKQVFRTNDNIQVAYNEQPINDAHKLSATALTADSFYLFTLGPLALSERNIEWQRLEDIQEGGIDYFRINGELKPGIGLSEADHITLWVNKKTELTFRLHFTLDGFAPTQGAHIDTSYLAYTTIGNFILPTHFLERVRAPLKINVHQWWYTGIDINRGLKPEDLLINEWSKAANHPAAHFSNKPQETK